MSPSERSEDVKVDVIEHPEVISLEPYQEIRGRLASVVSDDRYLYIELSSGTLRFDLDSPEASICGKHLNGNEETYVSFLRIADPRDRVLVKIEKPTPQRTFSTSVFGEKRKTES